jgi:anti-sigma regulatory factor (Ser/Thr protein kinase)
MCDGAGDNRHLRVVLAPDPSAAATARQVVEDACRAWRLDHVQEAAQLVITELVSNVVRHAGTKMEISLTARPGELRLAVRDGHRAPPGPDSAGGTLAESGRGLVIIQALAAEWGATPTADGKVVWAVLPC